MWEQMLLSPGVLEGEIAADAFKKNADIDKNGDGICQYVVLER